VIGTALQVPLLTAATSFGQSGTLAIHESPWPRDAKQIMDDFPNTHDHVMQINDDTQTQGGILGKSITSLDQDMILITVLLTPH